jgi:hypothetical protein
VYIQLGFQAGVADAGSSVEYSLEYSHIPCITQVAFVLNWCQDHQNQELNEPEKFVERLYDNISWSTVISLVLQTHFTQFCGVKIIKNQD